MRYFRKRFEFLVAQQPRGPPVTKAGLAPLGPWAVFLTWDRPTGADPDDLWSYKLRFNNYVIHIPATSQIMFHTQHIGISPGQPVTADIVALYNTKAESAPMTIGMRNLPARESIEFIAFSLFLWVSQDKH